jgi:hypothetical protein
MASIYRKYRVFRPIIELGRMLSAIGLMRDNTGSLQVTMLIDQASRVALPQKQ